MPHINSEFEISRNTMELPSGTIPIGTRLTNTISYFGLPRRLTIPATNEMFLPVTISVEVTSTGTINLPENPTDDDYDRAYNELEITFTTTREIYQATYNLGIRSIGFSIILEANDVMLGGAIAVTFTKKGFDSSGYPYDIGTSNLVPLTTDVILYEP